MVLMISRRDRVYVTVTGLGLIVLKPFAASTVVRMEYANQAVVDAIKDGLAAYVIN